MMSKHEFHGNGASCSFLIYRLVWVKCSATELHMMLLSCECCESRHMKVCAFLVGANRITFMCLP